MRMTHSDEFRCSAEQLWSFIEEPEKQKLWMKGLLENQPTSEGPAGVGRTFRMKIREGRRVADYDGKITAYDRPRRLAVDLTGGALPCGAVVHVDYQLAEHAGRTHLDYAAAFEAQRLSWWMRLMMPIGKVFARMQLNSLMKKLKQLAEAPQGDD